MKPLSEAEFEQLIEWLQDAEFMEGIGVIPMVRRLFANQGSCAEAEQSWIKVADGEGTRDAHSLRRAEAEAGSLQAFFCLYNGDFYEYRVKIPPITDWFTSAQKGYLAASTVAEGRNPPHTNRIDGDEGLSNASWDKTEPI